MTKYCPGCQTDKPTEDFRGNCRRKDGLQGYCRDCDKKKQVAHYEKNKSKYIEKAHQAGRRNAAWWREFKKTLRCNRCPESHPSCLQFHHIDPKKKEVTVSQVIRYWSRKRIMEEVAKCEVLCANCHCKEHWREVVDSNEIAGGGKSVCKTDV